MTRTRLHAALAAGAALAFAASPAPARAQSLEFGPPYTITGGFQNPFGVAVDGTRLVVADTRNRRLRWTLTSSLIATPTFTDFGYVADTALATALISPEGIASDGAGHVYVADARRNEVKLYTWDAATSNYVYDPNFTSASRRTVGGVDILAPRDVAVGPTGIIYLLDSGRRRVLNATGPAATSWTLAFADPLLGNPYGIAVAPDGRVYIADTDNHHIIRYEVGGARTVFGRFGTGSTEMRYPRDVAVDVDSRMYIVDTHNNRLLILDATGHHLLSLGSAPGIGAIQKIVLDASRHIYIADGDRDAVLAFLGADAPVPYDAWLRDYVGDDGAQPSDPSFTLASPDILVRHASDVDTAAARVTGLDAVAFEHPRYDRDNFVYVLVRNRGTQTLFDAVAKLYWVDPSTTLAFPALWHDDGFFSGPTASSAGDAIPVPPIPPGGSIIVGPLRWRPPAPEGAGLGNGTFAVGVRIVQPYDVAPAGAGPSAIRESNNVAIRTVHVVRGPFPTGNQNLLVVRARYSNDMTPIPEMTVMTRVASLATWATEVSWGTTAIDPLYRGEITLPQTRAYYQDPTRSMLVEMTNDALGVLLAAEPTLLDGASAAASDDIGRIIIVTNDTPADMDWATTGSWPYHLPAADRYLTVSVQGMNNSAAAYEHGMGHQLSLLDLFAYPNVTFPRPFADGWDNMAMPFTGVHPTVWSKQLATWVTEHGAQIQFIPRPPRGMSYTSPSAGLPLDYQATVANGRPAAIAIGLTPGVGTLTDETAFYFLEARSTSAGASDAALPGSGVLMYYVNTQIPQGQGPIIVRDHGTGTAGLADAAIPAGGSESPAGTGITAAVRAGTAGAAYLIDLTYTPPPTGYDVSINVGDPAWTSPDIWVDNQSDGYDEDAGRPLTDRGDVAIGGEENRVYARVHNAGPADAFDVEVAFFISEPYHTVGGEGDFTFLKSVVIPHLVPGDNIVYVTWTPSVHDPHTCVKVVLRRLLDDINTANNSAQQNLQVEWSTSHSPYTQVDFPFQITNPSTVSQLVYFRADQVPAGWTRQIVPEKAYLAPGQKFTGTLSLTPPPNAPNCTRHEVFVTAWTPTSHTLSRVGGSTVVVNLAKLAGVDFHLDSLGCTDENYKLALDRQQRELIRRARLRDSALKASGGSAANSQIRLQAYAAPSAKVAMPVAAAPCLTGACIVFHPRGCTDPIQANAEVIIRYKDPDGNPVYHTVTTDANGCFDDFYVAASSGTWDITASVAGSNCLSPIQVDQTVTLGVPGGGATGTVGIPGGPEFASADRLTRLYYQARGSMEMVYKGAARCLNCRVATVDHAVRMGLTPIGSGVPGELMAPRLRSVFGDSARRSGLHEGAATIRLKDGTLVVGAMHGVTNTIAHLGATTKAGYRLEGQFIGRAAEGDRRGCRLVIQYSLRLSADPSTGSASIAGLTDGVWDCACKTGSTPAVTGVDSLPSGCVFAFSAAGDGRLRQTSLKRNECGGASVVTQLDTGRAALSARAPTAPAALPYATSSFAVDSLVLLYEKFPAGVALHGAPFTLQGPGGERISGRILGLTHVNPHRAGPAPVRPHHFEGIIRGDVLTGALRNCQLRGVYSLDYSATATLANTATRWSIVGAIVCPCATDSARERGAADRPAIAAPVAVPPGAARAADSAMRARAGAVNDSMLTAQYGKASSLTAAERVVADVDKNGKISPTEVANIRLARARFDSIDTNRDGWLSEKEFVAFYTAHIPVTLLRTLDRNHNGQLDSAEAASLPLMSRKVADTDHNGTISSEELQAWARASAARTFARLDTKKDGRLSFAEFYRDGNNSGSK